MVCTECDAYIDEKTKEAHNRNKNTLFGAIGVASGAGFAALLSGILTTLQLLDVTPILPGLPGSIGPAGAAGPAGTAGATGDKGPKGDYGDAGTNGQDGEDKTNHITNISIDGHTLTVTYANEVKTYFVPAMSRRFQQAVAEEYLDGRHSLNFVGVRPSTVF